MQSETFGREMWGGGASMKRSLPTLFSRSTHSGSPGTGGPPTPAQGHSPTNVLQAGCSGPHGVPRLNG